MYLGKKMCMCGPWPYHYTPQHVSIVCWRYRGICSPNMSQPEAIQDEKIVVCKQICLCGLCGLCCSWTWISLLLVSFSVGFLVPKALDSRVVCHSPMFIGILVRTSLVGGLEHFFIFHNIWDNPSHWLIFFRGVETTNQINIVALIVIFVA